MKIVVIAGIRAQFMKLASLQRAVLQWNLSTPNNPVEIVSINSGQHYDDTLSKRFIDELGVSFEHDLTHLHINKEPTYLFANMFIELGKTLMQIEDADWIVVFGDANTTLAGALAAARLKLPLVHIESGVRSHNINRVEEQNRLLTDHLSTVCFYSSRQDYKNLVREGIKNNVFWSGDIIYDLVLSLREELTYLHPSMPQGEYMLCTLHREENVTDRQILKNCIYALRKIDMPILLITHPRTRRYLEDISLSISDNIIIEKSLAYKEMLSAIDKSRYIFTDSGALQREAFYLSKRCVVRQDEPFWKHLVDIGAHVLAPTHEDGITKAFAQVEDKLMEPYPVSDDLGYGDAGKKVLNELLQLV